MNEMATTGFVWRIDQLPVIGDELVARACGDRMRGFGRGWTEQTDSLIGDPDVAGSSYIYYGDIRQIPDRCWDADWDRDMDLATVSINLRMFFNEESTRPILQFASLHDLCAGVLGVGLVAGAPDPPEPSSNDLNAVFQRLLAEWKKQTSHLSSVTALAMIPAYQQIIGMGTPAVPLLLQELRREPQHLFWALKAITRQDPVPERSRGNVREMSEAWLRWGRESGLVD